MTPTEQLSLAIQYLREIAELDPRKEDAESDYQHACAFGRARGKAQGCLMRLGVFEGEKETKHEQA